MKRPTFFEGVVFAAVAALLGSIGYTVLPSLLGLDGTLRVVVTGLALAYVLYLLRRSPETTGRIVTVGLWTLSAAACWLLVGDLLLFVLVHIGLIGSVRMLYHQPGPLAALLDAGLGLFALATGIWAFVYAQSVFLAVWTFFLVQALFVGIPAADWRTGKKNNGTGADTDRFQLAYRSAESALRRRSVHQ